MPDERVLDVRGQEPPQPLIQVLTALDELGPGEKLRMIHHREPFPLYEYLEENGFERSTVSFPDGHFEIVIWRPTP